MLFFNLTFTFQKLYKDDDDDDDNDSNDLEEQIENNVQLQLDIYDKDFDEVNEEEDDELYFCNQKMRQVCYDEVKTIQKMRQVCYDEVKTI